MTGPQCTRFQLRVFRVFQHQLPFSEDSLFFHLNKGRLSFQLDTKHRASGKWRAGVCFDNELEINLQFINTDHAMSLELISSFYKAWFSTKHITDFKKKKKNSRHHKGPAGSRRKWYGFVESMNLPACCCYWLIQSYEATRDHFYFQTEVDFRPKGPKTKDPSLGFRRQNNPDQQIPQVRETLTIGPDHIE